MIGSSPLKSPLVKRPPFASVTLQGWLYKQGSEGLMLWKKRWFVLSEYCLFYYKSKWSFLFMLMKIIIVCLVLFF